MNTQNSIVTCLLLLLTNVAFAKEDIDFREELNEHCGCNQSGREDYDAKSPPRCVVVDEADGISQHTISGAANIKCEEIVNEAQCQRVFQQLTPLHDKEELLLTPSKFLLTHQETFICYNSTLLQSSRDETRFLAHNLEAYVYHKYLAWEYLIELNCRYEISRRITGEPNPILHTYCCNQIPPEAHCKTEDCFISAIGYMLPPDTSKSPSQMGATNLKDFRTITEGRKTLKPMSAHEVREKLNCPHKSEYNVTEEPNNRPGRNRARTKLTQLIEWTPWNYIGITLVAGLILILTIISIWCCCCYCCEKQKLEKAADNVSVTDSHGAVVGLNALLMVQLGPHPHAHADDDTIGQDQVENIRGQRVNRYIEPPLVNFQNETFL
ncbi:uncharacterized protein LOC134839448 isoform X2 [Symsagittifera roscoffensis]|uniref:uncharacterized protein LOC134839448 isoform X2 n=1 Tax=Symsagittifera roscoffensis TaxID=84072 RepID=UPI00307C61DA